MKIGLGWGIYLLPLIGLSCEKVPIRNVNAAFVLADVSWFASEQTLFVFHELHADQGLNDLSAIEITYVTDEGRVDWTPLTDFEPIHTHLPVDCGPDTMCGSYSLHVPIPPRDVRIRLRYHPDGVLALNAPTVYNLIEPGPPQDNRSLIVYGVFDRDNRLVQWRARHQFPTLRNERVTELGLRRRFEIREQAYGPRSLSDDRSPYAYNVSCPGSFTPTDFPPLATEERGIFNPRPLPDDAVTAFSVCAEATVTDATGTFTTGAVARKNPEVNEAFPLLRSPVHDAVPVPFFLSSCEGTEFPEHEAMQRQRLQMEGVPTTCTEGWEAPGFVEGLVVDFRAAIEAERQNGNDMVLVVGLYQNEPGLSLALEEALAQVVLPERHRTTPRLAGAFVLDSDARNLTDRDLAPATLWCPANLSLTAIPDASLRSCAVAPINPNLTLGPFSFGTLPILPSREHYLDFIERYSDGQAGEITALTYRTPEFAATAEHVDFGEFGVATFLNNERITAEADDAFSYCPVADRQTLVFRSGVLSFASEDGLLELSALPTWHNEVRERSYGLGIFWDFPFLLKLDYRVFTAGSVSAAGFDVPFGFGSTEESYYGTELWRKEEFPLGTELMQCRRFCDHPTFDSAGVYHVGDIFREAYANRCYLPAFPAAGDPGFPFDP